MATITSEHLLAACDQAESDNDTTRNLHDAAYMIARGEPARGGPGDDDYTDLPDDVRDGVISVLQSPGCTPNLVRRVINRDVRIGKGALIGDRAEIGAYVVIGDGAVIGACAAIGHGATIGEDAMIGDGAVIGDRAEIGAYAMIGDGAVIGERAEIDDGAMIDNAD